jgi:hypothetical protein
MRAVTVEPGLANSIKIEDVPRADDVKTVLDFTQ